MKLETLRDLYIAELKDLYSAENQLLEALPKMAKAASSPQLKKAFETHRRQTEQHIARLEEVFQTLDARPGGKHCKGMEGLVEEGEEMIKEKADADVKDAALISAAQRVEHYEIAGYGTVRTYAQTLGENNHAQILQKTLDEEAETDELLTQIAESTVNIDAASGANSR
jgi:ferritin-like metal-binding protein YciE